MTLLDQKIDIDIGHVLLFAALVGFVIYLVRRKEGLDVKKIHYKSCRCPSCAEVAYQQAVTGQLYGCNPSNPYVPYSPEECNYSYRKTMLHGCGIAN